MRKLFVAAATVAIFALLVTPAVAAPGGKGTPVTGTIDLAGAVTLSADSTSWPAYGDSVHFLTTVQGDMAPKSSVYVTVVCTQGGSIVYLWSADPGFEFPMVDQAGQGLDWTGGDADCTATLIYRVQSGRNVSYTWLDQTGYHVSA